MNSGDTIVAVSSAVGPAARMIARVSGPRAVDLLTKLSGAAAPDHSAILHTRLSFADLEIPATILFFHNPHSYTGDDLAELHIPGNPILTDLLLKHLLAAGARLAEAGEFTARAYFNGRLDLAQAEGVAATIAAGNAAELQAAQRLLAGELSRRLAPSMETLAGCLARVEADIDFSDEDIPAAARTELRGRLSALRSDFSNLLGESARFEPLTHEPRVVLVGRPNAGKSTLLNALVGRERAVTSPLAGTTRDVLSAELDLPRGRVMLMDVAGLDDSSPQSPLAEIDEKMRRHAWRAAESADVLALVVDSSDGSDPLKLPREPDLTIFSKCDLRSFSSPSPGTPGEGWGGGDRSTYAPSPTLTRSTGRGRALAIHVSALTGFNLNELRGQLDRLAFGDTTRGESLALNARHIRHIESAVAAVDRALADAELPLELLALELREALDALGGVLGQITPDDVLGKIFSSFCIGK